MSMDEAGKGPLTVPFVTEAELSKKKNVRKQQTVRKHKIETVNSNQLAQVLDAYAAEGRVVIALNISQNIGGSYECVSYKDEAVN